VRGLGREPTVPLPHGLSVGKKKQKKVRKTIKQNKQANKAERLFAG